MTKEIKVGKIIIEIGKRETPLTVEEAKALKAALCELFPEPKEVVTKEIIRERDYWPYWKWSYGPTLSNAGGLGLTGANSHDFAPQRYANLLDSGNDLKLSYCANSEPSL